MHTLLMPHCKLAFYASCRNHKYLFRHINNFINAARLEAAES